MKDQCTSDWSRDIPIVQNIGNCILARRGQSGGCKLNRAISLFVRPVKDSQNALSVVFSKEENAGLLILGLRNSSDPIGTDAFPRRII